MKKKELIFTSILTFIVLSVIIVVVVISKNKITVSLSGKDNLEVKVFSKYNDQGVIVKKGNKVLSDDKYKLVINGKVNTNKVGSYKLSYTVNKNKKTTVTRHVKVVDSEQPVLTLSSDKIVKDYCTKRATNEIDYTATDNYDGDLTNNVFFEELLDKVIYKVTDSSGNQEVKEVKITYSEKPADVFKLNGNENETILFGTEYKEKGATYTDGCGNKLKGDIKISGKVNPNEEGDYQITYTLDKKKTLTRIVHVKKYPHKNIYLTFDDGPGLNTQRILDTLDKYNVKATFFVTNQFPAYQSLINEEYKRGHSVGVHTLTHRWDIYDSVDAYINDFDQMNEIIKNQTGSYTKIFRFPGGSSNTVSKSHSKGVVTAIAQEMTNRGYVYFDWNLASSDADGKTSTEKIINTVINHVDSCRYDCVILFHDYKTITADALDPILAELTSRGYTFYTLNENSPETHSTIRN